MSLLDTIKDAAGDLLINFLFVGNAAFGCSNPAPGSTGVVDAGKDVEEPVDATPPPAEPACDAYSDAGDAVPPQFISDSYNAFDYLWPDGMDVAQPMSWQPQARLYFGALEDAFRPVCEAREDFASAEEEIYWTSVTNCFLTPPEGSALRMPEIQGEASNSEILGQHAPMRAIMLSLIECIGPAGVKREVVSAVLDKLRNANPDKKDFYDAIDAFHLFNMSAVNAVPATRYDNPVAGRMSSEDKEKVAGDMNRMMEILDGIDLAKLDDVEVEYLAQLYPAAEHFQKSIAAKKRGGTKATGGSSKYTKNDIKAPPSATDPVPPAKKFTIPNPGKY